MDATAIDHVNLGYPTDRLDDVIEFYVDKLGFETGFDDPYAAVENDPGLFAIDLGERCRLYVSPTEEFDPQATNYNHLAIRVPESPAAVRARLEAEGIAIEHEAEREREPIGAYTGFYVEDPVGYTIECMATGHNE